MNLQRISVRVDEDTQKWLNELSQESGESFSTVLRMVLRQARLTAKKNLRNN